MHSIDRTLYRLNFSRHAVHVNT